VPLSAMDTSGGLVGVTCCGDSVVPIWYCFSIACQPIIPYMYSLSLSLSLCLSLSGCMFYVVWLASLSSLCSRNAVIIRRWCRVVRSALRATLFVSGCALGVPCSSICIESSLPRACVGGSSARDT